MFLFAVQFFLMLAVSLSLSGFFLVEKYFGSGKRRAHRVNQVSRKI